MKVLSKIALILLILISSFLMYQNYKLGEENAILEMEVFIIKRELEIEKMHHQGDFEANISIIEKLKSKLDSISSVPN